MDTIIGFCPLCEGMGFILPAQEEYTADIVFACEYCENIFESLDDLKRKKARQRRSRYVFLSTEEAELAGLGKYLLYFDTAINKWVPFSDASASEKEEAIDTSEGANAPSDKDIESIRRYLVEIGMKDVVIAAVKKKFERHADLAVEFSYRICNGEFPPSCVSVHVENESFTAESLMKKHNRFETLHEAYSYLAFLRDEPNEALKMLERGLPVKD